MRYILMPISFTFNPSLYFSSGNQSERGQRRVRGGNPSGRGGSGNAGNDVFTPAPRGRGATRGTRGHRGRLPATDSHVPQTLESVSPNGTEKHVYPTKDIKYVYRDGGTRTIFAKTGNTRSVSGDKKTVTDFYKNTGDTKIQSEGKTTFIYATGKIEKRTTIPDTANPGQSTIIEEYRNGNIRTIKPNGMEEIYFAEGKVKKRTTIPDMKNPSKITVIEEYKDGNIRTISPDKTEKIQRPEGGNTEISWEYDPVNQTETKTLTFDKGDVAKLVYKKTTDGKQSETKYRRNGSIRAQSPGGTVREHFPASANRTEVERVTAPDGAQYKEFSNTGNKRFISADGQTRMDEFKQSGDTITVEREGAVSPTGKEKVKTRTTNYGNTGFIVKDDQTHGIKTTSYASGNTTQLLFHQGVQEDHFAKGGNTRMKDLQSGTVSHQRRTVSGQEWTDLWANYKPEKWKSPFAYIENINKHLINKHLNQADQTIPREEPYPVFVGVKFAVLRGIVPQESLSKKQREKMGLKA
jgi:hypothetical protein